MKDLDEMGAANCYRRALGVTSPKGEPIHLSFDVDGVDEGDMFGYRNTSIGWYNYS